MRLAYFSPLNPAPSGISDYSEELLPHLAGQADLTLVVDGYTPSNTGLTARLPVLDDRMYRREDFDLALYQLGNSPAHAYIYRRALREPGVIVMHDLVLHHLVAWLTLNHGDAAGYIQAMRASYGERGAQLARREALGLEALNRFDYPLSEQVIQNARGVIAHSHYVTNAVRRIAPGVPVAQIAHEMPDLPLVDRDTARAQLGLPPDALLVGSFGNLGLTKRTPVLFEALREARRSLPDLRLVLVGATSPNLDVQGLRELFGLGEAVQIVGHVPFNAFHLYMAAMDVCVNLRYPTAGETSGAVLRMMLQAKPVIVSRTGWFAELPDDAVAKIDVDDHEVELLRATLERLLGDVSLRTALGVNARQYVQSECAVDKVALRYGEFLRGVVENRVTTDVGIVGVYPAAGVEGQAMDDRPGTDEGGVTRKEKGRTTPDDTSQGDSSPSSVPVPVPPATTFDWRDQVAEAYVELGLAREDALLEQVAQAVVELGLSEPGAYPTRSFESDAPGVTA